jgi:hypothetical protein
MILNLKVALSSWFLSTETMVSRSCKISASAMSLGNIPGKIRLAKNPKLSFYFAELNKTKVKEF